MSALQATLAPDFAAVAALAPEWEALMGRSDATPFQAPGCLIPWARHHAPDRLAAAVVREGGRLVALVPAFSWQGAVLLAGTGPTDYNDAVVEAGRADAATLALEHMARLAAVRGCPTLDLQQLRPESLLLAAQTPEGWADERLPGDICPVAPVLGADGPNAGLGAMPPKWRKKLDYTRRKAAAAGGYVARLATAETVEAETWALLDLHRRRWEAAGETGVLAGPLMAGFLTDALPALQAEGRLRLWTLRFGGELAAVLCSLQDARAAHFYLQGVDPSYAALGPGTLLIAEAITAAAREGATELRFLRGEEPYKANWGAVAEPTWRRVVRLR